MFKADDFSCSADVGRINPEEPEYIINVVCPKMRTRNTEFTRPTMSAASCLIRVSEQHTCTINCTIATAIKNHTKERTS